jgi:hypothetical protein
MGSMYDYKPVMDPAAIYADTMASSKNIDYDVIKAIGNGVNAPGLGQTNQYNTPLGKNLGTANLALGAIGTIGNLWSAWQAQKLAKEQFNFQKGVTNTNLANQIQTYNTRLAGLAEIRGQMSGADPSTTQGYIQDNSLKDERP